MPIRSNQNLYPGINPHLQSFLQDQTSIWRNFHFEYISQLHQVIEVALADGYVVLAESSLQKRDETDDEEYMAGLVIYRVDEEDSSHGQPLIHIELIIPADKDRRAEYLARRQAVLQSGIILIELNYLHEYPPFIAEIPDYTSQVPDAYPYHIAVTHLDRSIEHPDLQMYGFGVDEPIPTVTLSLLDVDDSDLEIDFHVAYHAVFESMKFWGSVVDYAREPANMERYREDDQERIRTRMAQIAEKFGEE